MALSRLGRSTSDKFGAALVEREEGGDHGRDGQRALKAVGHAELVSEEAGAEHGERFEPTGLAVEAHDAGAILLKEQEHGARSDDDGDSGVDMQSEDGEFVAQGAPPCSRWLAAP
jgi:hypothetical protein